jgi:hypothetical protein
VNVEEQKQQARVLEQQGETEAALEICEKILAELEGTPEMWRELPLHVKAGDLSLKLNNSNSAISHYEKAANAYAAYGSAKSVIALCIKILRVNPNRTHVFLRLVRLMIEREHLAEARLVLLEYSERLKLPKAGLVLHGLADTPEEEMKPVLDMLLELGGRYEYARAQGRDDVTDSEYVEDEVEPFGMEKAASPDSDPEATVSLAEAEQMDQLTDRADENKVAAGEPAASDSEIEQAGDVESEKDHESSHGSTDIERAKNETQWVDEGMPIPMSPPRSSRQVLFREAEKRRNKPNAVWIVLGGAAVVVVVGLSLVLFDVVPLGSDGPNQTDSQSQLTTTPSDSVLAAGVDPEDTTLAEEVVDSAPSSESGTPVSGSLRATSVIRDSSVPDQDVSPSLMEVEVDTQEAGEPVPPEEMTATPDQPAIPPGMGVMVQDFDVDSNTEFEADGRVGYRVTQTLGTGEQLTLSAVYYGEEISAAPGTDSMTLAPLVGDTTTAIIRFNGYFIEARALVSATVLEALLNRLVEVPRSN